MLFISVHDGQIRFRTKRHALDFFCKQIRINHWANRANAQGFALEYQNTLLVFHVFKLFTTRQNCGAFNHCV